MPAIGSGGGGGPSRPSPPVRLPPRPPSIPGPQPSVGTAIAQGAAHPAAPLPQHTEGAPGTPLVPHVSPAAGVRGGTGPQISKSQYRAAVMRVFDHQPAPLKLSIVGKALQAPTPLGNMILQSLRAESPFNVNPASLPQPVRMELPAAQVYTSLVARGVKVPGLSSNESPSLKAAMAVVFKSQSMQRRAQIEQSAQKLGIVPKAGSFFDAINFAGDKLAGVVASGLAQFRSGTTPGGGHDIASIQGGPAGGQFAQNAAKDLVSLPASTLTSLGVIGRDVVTGHEGQAAKDVTQPFVQLAEHPGQTFMQHPLNTALMVGGLLHGASRVAAAPVRALAPADSAVGRALSTTREPVALTGNLTHERPAFSKSPTIKAQQKAVEAALYERSPTGELVPRHAQLRTRQINAGVGELVGVAERIRRANREAVILAREKAVRPSVARRVGHSAKTVLAYAPKAATIPGADVLARIADGTVRRPETVAVDLEKHLKQVAATRPELLGDPQALRAHDAYVKQIRAALDNKRFLKDPGPAFKAAEAYAKDYKVVEARAHKLGHYGDMRPQELERRALSHYAVTHMGARMDPELGLVVDRAVPGAPRTAGDISPVGAQPRTEPVPLSTEAIRKHAEAQLNGRELAYTPDRVSFDRSNKAFYVSSERRPLPATKRTTLYAYTHGLTRPGHDALTEQHALTQGVVDSHLAQNRYLETLATQKPGGGYWDTYAAAKHDAPQGYVPINVSQPFHPQSALDQALQDVAPASIEEEAVRRSLDLRDRLQPGTKGRWAIVDQQTLKALKAHENQIQPNTLLRTIRGLNNQFRTVALSTSAKHVPGVIQENLIRDIGNGVGFRSWVTGRRILKTAGKLNPEEARNLRIHLTGGQVAGMTEAGKTYAVSDHWSGTSAYPVLKAFEATFKMPVARQARTLWRAWTKFAIRGVKKALEEQHQIAGLGKASLREHGYAEALKTQGYVGLIQRAFALHGSMLEDAAKGLFDQGKARQMRAEINRLYGKWTDLSPSAQTALMFSPFGLWWVNSARFLARMPVDMPVKTSLLAAANTGTQKERKALGLDLFAPNALPLYEQGGIPLPGGKVMAQNYYSPFGIANDPLETGQSMLQPWLLPLLQGAGGVDWLWRPLTSPSNSRGYKESNMAQRAQYILNSALASFVPLYMKAQTVLAGGQSSYDVTDKGGLPALGLPTKEPGKGFGAGLSKALNPVRVYRGSSSSSSSSSGSIGGGSIGGGSIGAGSIGGGTIK